MSEPVVNDASTSDAVADDTAVQTPTTMTETPTPANEEKPAPSSSRGKATAEREERIAPVVSIFDRKRVSAPTSNDEREPIAKAPEHPVFERPETTSKRPESPVFERVEVQPEVESSTPAPSRVDEIFERLRSSSTQRVAQDTKKDLVKKETTPKAVRPRPVDPAVFRQRDEVVSGALDAMKRSVKRLSADDENAVLTHVGTKRSVLSLEAMLPAPAEHAQRYADAMKEEVTAIAVNAARSLSESRRADLRKVVVDGAVLDAVTSFVASDLLHPLRERIAAALTQAANDRDVAMKSIRSAFAEWKAQHMESVVVDIAHLAYARGLFLGCESTSHVCWAVDPNGPACADAEDNALAGRVRRGEKFPTGHEQPLAHAGCRCLVVPLDK